MENNVIEKSEIISIVNLELLLSMGGEVDIEWDFISDLDSRKDGIVIEQDNVTINGNNHVIDLNGNGRGLRIRGNNVTIKNFIIANGNVENQSGGAIYNEGGLNLENVTFIWNRCLGDDDDYIGGGAIFNEGLLSITSCKFEYNRYNSLLQDNDKIYGNGGGAIHNRGILNITDSEFRGNNSSNAGGAIHNRGILDITNTEFDDNSSKHGGAIFSRLSLDANGCNFKNNSASDSPNIHSTNRGEATVYDCKFDNEIPENLMSNQRSADYLKLLIKHYSEIDLKYDIRLTFPNSTGIEIDVEKLTINGNGHEINGDEEYCFFEIVNGDVVLKDIKFKNGCPTNKLVGKGSKRQYPITTKPQCRLTMEQCEFKDNKGELILNEGEMTLTRTTFENNIVDYPRLIYNSHGELNINESSFLKNDYSSIMTNLLYNKNGTIKINKTLFEENSVKSLLNLGGKVKVNNSKFSNNEKTPITNEKGEMEINKSEFENNLVETEGSLISNGEESTLKINETLLNDNTIVDEGLPIYNKGGMNIYYCTVSRHRSDSALILNENELVITESTFEENFLEAIIRNNDGGDVEISNANLNIESGAFKNNKSRLSAIVNNGKYCNVEDVLFEDNESENEYCADITNYTLLELHSMKYYVNEKQSILNRGTILTNTQENFEKSIKNYGKIKGKGEQVHNGFNFSHLDDMIHIAKSKEITLDYDISLEEFEEKFYNGGIELDIDGLTIDGNHKTITANNLSRIFIVTGKDIKIRNLIFKDGNTLSSHSNISTGGGAIQVNSLSSLTLENCEFHFNRCVNYGGGILNFGKIALIDTKFIENQAKHGGAVYNYENGSLIIDNSEFNDNASELSGGSITNKGKLEITGSEFSKNKSKLGGAITNLNKSDITNTTFECNDAENGGSLFNKGRLEISNSKFLKNTASTAGAINNKLGEMSLEKTEFKGNHVKGDGGAINNNGKLNSNKTLFLNNCSDYEGGAIINLHEGILKLCDVKFQHNRSNLDGGAIFNHGNIELKRTQFESNTSEKRGGAIFNWYKMNLSYVIFKNNNANTYGGAITNKHNINIKNCMFITNQSINEGNGIYNVAHGPDRGIEDDHNSSMQRFYDVEFDKYEARLTIENSTFLNNASLPEEISTGDYWGLKSKNCTFNNVEFEINELSSTYDPYSLNML